jgi:hypothetical protein
VIERMTIALLGVLLVATLVGCLRYDIERVAASNLAPVASDHSPNRNAAL